MTCPRCCKALPYDSIECPDCGIGITRAVSGLMKTSAVFISSGDDQTFYRSVQDVPEPLRQKLIDTTTGTNSGTIIIADRAGRAQLTHELLHRAKPQNASRVRKSRLTFLAWMCAALVLTGAGLFAAFFPMRW